MPRCPLGTAHETRIQHIVKSEFVRLNPRLFSKAEDERPVPRVGSLEWKQLQERDAERERELRKASHICDC